MALLFFGAGTMLSTISLLALILLVSIATSSSYSSMEMQTYIVHMDTSKVTALAGTKRWPDAVIDSLLEFSAQEEESDQEAQAAAPQLLYVYETAFFGFAAKLSAKQAKTLQKIDGFLSAYPDDISIRLHTTYSPEFLGLSSGKGLWKSPNLASDVIIGLVDTGIWPEHVSFRDAHMPAVPARWKGGCEVGTKFSPKNCNKKLIGANAYYKGYEALVGKINETREYRSARDSEGHGTHTASTAAGNIVAGAGLFGNAKGAARGMRYTARIAAYKACWTSGCANSDILAAVDRAVADGVDILSLSIGGGSKPYYMDSIAIAAFGAIQKGVFVSCSGGNSGPSDYTVSNTAPWIMTVAASYLDRTFPTTIMLGDGRTFKGASLYAGKPTKLLPIVYNTSAGGGEDAGYCVSGSLSRKLVRGKIVLCDRGLNGQTQKGEQVKLAGGAGMLSLNSESQGEDLLAYPHVLPASALSFTAGKAIKDYIASSSKKKPTAMITFQGTAYGEPAPMIAAFSSRGPSLVGPDIIKPDVTAPGVNILAAWPPSVSPSLLESDRRKVGFNIISGTSMSCPHVSGLAALLKSEHPNWSPAAIKSALMTTAYTRDNRNASIVDVSSGSPATPFAFGSGHVDPERAMDPGLVYDITPNDYLAYLCSLNYTSTQIAMLARIKRYSCRNGRVLRAEDLNYPSFALEFGGGRRREVTVTRTVTNVGRGRCRYTVDVREPEGVSMSVEPRVLVFGRMGQKLRYKVSFVDVGGRSGSAFGELVWVCGEYSVRSPVAVTWE